MSFLNKLSTGYKKKVALINNLRRIITDEELVEKILRVSTTREIKMTTFIAIQHGEEAVKTFYEDK